MSKTPSFAYQIQKVFDGGLAIGTSRLDAKTDMQHSGGDPRFEMTPQIHGWGTYDTEMKTAITVFKDLKADYGAQIKYIRDVTPDMIRARFEDYKAQGLSPNTLVSRQTGLRRLEQLSIDQKVIATPFMPRDLGLKREFSPRGAYTPAEARAIVDRVSALNPAIGQVLAVIHTAGLRIREAIKLRSDLIPVKRTDVPGDTRTRIPGVDVARGVVFVEGKGGRQREVAVFDKRVLAGLDLHKRYPLRAPNQTEKNQMRRIQELVRQVCLELKIQPRGVHAFRATAANQFLNDRLAEGETPNEAKRKLACWLGHGRTGVLKHYLQDKR